MVLLRSLRGQVVVSQRASISGCGGCVDVVGLIGSAKANTEEI